MKARNGLILAYQIDISYPVYETFTERLHYEGYFMLYCYKI